MARGRDVVGKGSDMDFEMGLTIDMGADFFFFFGGGGLTDLPRHRRYEPLPHTLLLLLVLDVTQIHEWKYFLD